MHIYFRIIQPDLWSRRWWWTQNFSGKFRWRFTLSLRRAIFGEAPNEVNACTLLGVQSWVRFCQQEFGEVPGWWAATVATYCPDQGNYPNSYLQNLANDRTPRAVLWCAKQMCERFISRHLVQKGTFIVGSKFLLLDPSWSCFFCG